MLLSCTLYFIMQEKLAGIVFCSMHFDGWALLRWVLRSGVIILGTGIFIGQTANAKICKPLLWVLPVVQGIFLPLGVKWIPCFQQCRALGAEGLVGWELGVHAECYSNAAPLPCSLWRGSCLVVSGGGGNLGFGPSYGLPSDCCVFTSAFHSPWTRFSEPFGVPGGHTDLPLIVPPPQAALCPFRWVCLFSPIGFPSTNRFWMLFIFWGCFFHFFSPLQIHIGAISWPSLLL